MFADTWSTYMKQNLNEIHWNLPFFHMIFNKILCLQIFLELSGILFSKKVVSTLFIVECLWVWISKLTLLQSLLRAMIEYGGFFGLA